MMMHQLNSKYKNGSSNFKNVINSTIDSASAITKGTHFRSKTQDMSVDPLKNIKNLSSSTSLSKQMNQNQNLQANLNHLSSSSKIQTMGQLTQPQYFSQLKLLQSKQAAKGEDHPFFQRQTLLTLEHSQIQKQPYFSSSQLLSPFLSQNPWDSSPAENNTHLKKINDTFSAQNLPLDPFTSPTFLESGAISLEERYKDEERQKLREQLPSKNKQSVNFPQFPERALSTGQIFNQVDPKKQKLILQQKLEDLGEFLEFSPNQLVTFQEWSKDFLHEDSQESCKRLFQMDTIPTGREGKEETPDKQLQQYSSMQGLIRLEEQALKENSYQKTTNATCENKMHTNSENKIPTCSDYKIITNSEKNFRLLTPKSDCKQVNSSLDQGSELQASPTTKKSNNDCLIESQGSQLKQLNFSTWNQELNRLSAVERRVRERGSAVCSLHGQQLVLYDKIKKRVRCLKCVFSEEGEDKYEQNCPIQEQNNLGEDIQEMIICLQRKQNELERTQNHLNNYSQTVFRNEQNQQAKISSIFSSIKKELDIIENEIKLKLNQEIKQVIENTSNCLQSVRATLRAIVQPLLYSQSALENQINVLQQTSIHTLLNQWIDSLNSSLFTSIIDKNVQVVPMSPIFTELEQLSSNIMLSVQNFKQSFSQQQTIHIFHSSSSLGKLYNSLSPTKSTIKTSQKSPRQLRSSLSPGDNFQKESKSNEIPDSNQKYNPPLSFSKQVKQTASGYLKTTVRSKARGDFAISPSANRAYISSLHIASASDSNGMSIYAVSPPRPQQINFSSEYNIYKVNQNKQLNHNNRGSSSKTEKSKEAINRNNINNINSHEVDVKYPSLQFGNKQCGKLVQTNLAQRRDYLGQSDK